MNFTTFKDLTRLEQTLFGLPFILAGVLLPFNEGASLSLKLFWVLPAFLSARISGMAFNQLIDCRIDAANPRTKNRVIPSGKAAPKEARLVAWGALFFFLGSCSQINSFCFTLSFFIAFLLFIYSYMKRIHASCHLVLGVIHFFGPVMASAAICGMLSKSSLCLGAAAFFSICGNDIAYAIQDCEFDKANALHSIPSRLGTKKAMIIAIGLHFSCLIAFASLGVVAKLPLVYYLILPFLGAVFYRFHSTIYIRYKKTGSLQDLEGLFFFNVVAVSMSAIGFITLSVLWAVMS